MNRIDQLQELLREDSSDPFLHFALAKEFEKVNDHTKAMEKYTHLLDSFPKYLGTYYHAGKCLEAIGLPYKALGIYDKGVELAEEANDHHSLRELREIQSDLQNRLLADSDTNE